eukprot:472638-Prymnesium_polylepis.1
MKRVSQHGASAGADTVSCRPADRVMTLWGGAPSPSSSSWCLSLGCCLFVFRLFSSLRRRRLVLSRHLCQWRVLRSQRARSLLTTTSASTPPAGPATSLDGGRNITTTTSVSTPPDGPATPLDGGRFLRSLETIVEGVVQDL